MAWSDEARRAAAEARRLHANARARGKGIVNYGGVNNYEWTHGHKPSGRGYWAFDVQGRYGAKHQVWMRDQMYSQAKKNILALGKRVSARGKTGSNYVRIKVLT